jgi:HAD superfamily hydrolase (TIGR01490 family)
MALAIFDLDRTLVRKDTAGLFIRNEYRAGRASLGRVALVGAWRGLYTVGLVDAARVAGQVLDWYRGRQEAELRAATLKWFQGDVLPLICDRGRRAVEAHRARGDKLMLVTASTQFVAELVATELEIPHVVCSEVDVRGGVLTGALVGPLCYGEGKLEKVRAFSLLHGGVEQLAQGTVYTDSVTDLPLLEAVKYPVAVNPDLRLRAIARRRAWPVQEW